MINTHKIQIPQTNFIANGKKQPEINTFKGKISLNNPKPITPNLLSFGKMHRNDSYDKHYIDPDYNGNKNDTYILEKLTTLLPIKKTLSDKFKSIIPIKKNYNYGKLVLDLGAGDGRNSIPIAKAGYNVTSVELSDNGRSIINQKVKKNGLQNNITTKKIDILSDTNLNLKEHDFAIMTHVSQHFNEKELDKVFSNISNCLKPGGYFIFDALIRKKDYVNKSFCDKAEASGFVNFDQTFVENLAKQHNFKLVEPPCDYNEEPNVRKTKVDYINSPLWGNAPYNLYNLNVKLKWFVLRKKL